MKLRWRFLIGFLIFILISVIFGTSTGIVSAIANSIIIIIIMVLCLVFTPKEDRMKRKYETFDPIYAFTEDFIVVSKETFDEFDKFGQEFDLAQDKLKALNEDKLKLEDDIKELEKKCDTLLVIEDKVYTDLNSEEVLKDFKMIDMQEKNFISNISSIKLSSREKTKFFKAQLKQIYRSFVAETDSIINAVSHSNYESSLNKILKAYKSLNKLYEIDNVKIEKDFLELKTKKLMLMYQYRLKKKQEKEQQKAIKEQMKEDEKVRRELENEKKKLNKEINQFNKELKKIMEYMAKSDSEVEKKFYVEKIQELESKIEQLEKNKENVLEREANTRAGFVYIISNIGSFGNDVFKIGMTRRLEPMDRVKELSSASVPFEFDVHAMIFSDDAPSLESAIHNKFRDKAVNKANDRKEFFKIPLLEIKEFVNNEFGLTVEFTELAKAEEYYRTLEIENKMQNM